MTSFEEWHEEVGDERLILELEKANAARARKADAIQRREREAILKACAVEEAIEAAKWAEGARPKSSAEFRREKAERRVMKKKDLAKLFEKIQQGLVD